MNTLTFKDYNLKLELVPFTNIIGGIASGKTYLLKTLINQSDSSSVFIDDKPPQNGGLSFCLLIDIIKIILATCCGNSI